MARFIRPDSVSALPASPADEGEDIPTEAQRRFERLAALQLTLSDAALPAY